MTSEALILAAAFFCLAALYSSVGHAGASGYLATMALLGVAPATMRPTALALNLIVATLTTYRFWRAGWTRWKNCCRLRSHRCRSLTSAGAYGTRDRLSRVVGVVLLCTAAVLIWRARVGESTLAERPLHIPLVAAVGSGAAIGCCPDSQAPGAASSSARCLLLAGWAGPRGAAGLAAPFICLNSLAGLIGVQWPPTRCLQQCRCLPPASLLEARLALQWDCNDCHHVDCCGRWRRYC